MEILVWACTGQKGAVQSSEREATMRAAGQWEELVHITVGNAHVAGGQRAFEAMDLVRYNKTYRPEFPNRCEAVAEMTVGGWHGISCKYRADDGRTLTLQVAKFRPPAASVVFATEFFTPDGAFDYEAKLFGPNGGAPIAWSQNFFAQAPQIEAAFQAVLGTKNP